MSTVKIYLSEWVFIEVYRDGYLRTRMALEFMSLFYALPDMRGIGPAEIIIAKTIKGAIEFFRGLSDESIKKEALRFCMSGRAKVSEPLALAVARFAEVGEEPGRFAPEISDSADAVLEVLRNGWDT